MGTDKSIIIDGCNVAGCKFLYDDDCLCKLGIEYGYDGEAFGRFCKADKDCYFKQLKRLEQENHAIKRALKDKNIVAIVEENERLKKEIEKMHIECAECDLKNLGLGNDDV